MAGAVILCSRSQVCIERLAPAPSSTGAVLNALDQSRSLFQICYSFLDSRANPPPVDGNHVLHQLFE